MNWYKKAQQDYSEMDAAALKDFFGSTQTSEGDLNTPLLEQVDEIVQRQEVREKPMNLYRGERRRAAGATLQLLSGKKVGDTITISRPMSTSINPTKALEFSGKDGVLLCIMATKYMSSNKFNTFSEFEIVLPSGQFEILSMSKPQDIRTRDSIVPNATEIWLKQL